MVWCCITHLECDIRLCDVVFFQAEDGIRYLVRSRGLGDVYKRQTQCADLLARVAGSGQNSK